jgi:hypothetical protein
VDDYPPRNRHREDWDFLEGRGTPPPGTPSNVVRFPVEPPAHIATSQRIAAEAGILPAITVVTTPEPTPDAPIPDERGEALLVKLVAHLTGRGKPPREPWE